MTRNRRVSVSLRYTTWLYEIPNHDGPQGDIAPGRSAPLWNCGPTVSMNERRLGSSMGNYSSAYLWRALHLAHHGLQFRRRQAPLQLLDW